MQRYMEAFDLGLKPDPILTVSEWSDKYRILSQKASEEPGYWRTSRTPYLREIMDCLSVIDPTERIVFMKGAQIGGTEAGNNWIGYVIDYAPSAFMAIQPTTEMAKRNSKQRIAPLVEACPRLREKVKDPRSRDSGNTMLTKEFPGGVLIMTGANSAVGLRSLPARYLFLDEIDAYPQDVDGEGDPVSLAIARSRTFSKRKIFMVSTPTIEGRSKIEVEYQNSDQRRFHVPCPLCGEFDWLKWSQVKWEKGEALDAWYECEHCNGRIENWQKTTMLESGEWVAEKPGAQKGRVAGFHLSSLYSPVGWVSWGELAELWVNAQKSRERLRTFINTVLGETWKDKGEAPDWKRLYERRDKYPFNSVPEGVLFITAGVDIQKDRIEIEIKGWGRKKRSWSIDYRVLPGDTSSVTNECWKELSNIVHEVWTTKNKTELPLKRMAVDSGYNTQVVYTWCRQYPITKVIPIKGVDSQSVLIGQPKAVDVTIRGRKMSKGLKMFPIGVNLIKSETYGFLKMPSPDEGEEEPHGYCHFPEYSEDYFLQLTAEEMVVRIVKGYKRYEWQKIRDRNEVLDCHVYSRAAAAACGIDRFKDTHWVHLEKELGIEPNAKMSENDKKQEIIVEKPKKIIIKRRKSKFL